MEDPHVYDGPLPVPGCSPDFIPDEGLANRPFDAVTIPDQLEAARKRWLTDPRNAEAAGSAATAPAARDVHTDS